VAFRALQSDGFAVPEATAFSLRLSVKSGTEMPGWIFVAFQTNRSGNQRRNPAVFDHVRVRNIYALLNSDSYPVVDINLDFEERRTSRSYKALKDFKEDSNRIDGRESSNQVTPSSSSASSPSS
jgi:hypothetical protein